MTSKQKNIGLIIGFIVSLFLVYNFAIKNTFNYKNQYKKLLKEKDLLNNAESKINFLQRKNRHIDSILTSKNISIENSFQQTILQNITRFSASENIQIVNFNAPHLYTNNNTITETLTFEARGDYHTLLKLINFIEQEQLGKLLSTHFEKKKNYRTNRNYLTVIIYLQKISKN
ncbi:hypothetical protein [Tenacibaculum sp. M341]|uniref:hypothetical protein n=1 Tax=Tenacibaculum sp. M341 TaxID=2530339 RepID=UPI001048F189|nr:hypothetical protein [Tenacibaculum sp. M341]TCI85585.1 hypothetical protein EYW44_16635 [Tenacibaculum sp. M341]